MQISKFLHSCVLFEQEEFKLLIDPGTFSFAEGLVTPEQFADVNAVIITHIHPDHLDIDILKKIISLSGAMVYTNREVNVKLNAENLEANLLINSLNRIGPFDVEAFDVIHEPLLDSQIPQMTGLVINGKVLHPVDSFMDDLQRFHGIELLLLPVMAPFTNELTIASFADRLQPKQVLPVHDGFAKPFFVQSRYKTFAAHFEKQGIVFHGTTEVGASVEL